MVLKLLARPKARLTGRKIGCKPKIIAEHHGEGV
eukprot:SAG25_NODE_12498_length_279_cov_0.716667_1_plen_33_part_10